MQPGGRLIGQGMPMRFLLMRAFTSYTNDQLVGLPKWVDSERFDITAKAPTGATFAGGLDPEALAPLMRSLLADRFQMKYHMEDRPHPAYTLVAGKPKMKKADPDSRISCKSAPAGPGTPPGSTTITCQNTSMALLAERLRTMGPGLNAGVVDATGLEGGWDFTLTFSVLPLGIGAPPRGPDAEPAGGLPAASDPSGGYTIFEAVERQLGLKLESQKRTVPVVVIDHLEQKPVEN
jgi:uncharacterized protein (TIGR03435 family)